MNKKENSHIEPLPDELVRHMAMLSRLSLKEEEVKLFGRQFATILGYMNILAEVNTEGVEALYSCASNAGHERRDIADNIRSREEILANAPETDGECFMVPRII